jgi:hypothetical protein
MSAEQVSSASSKPVTLKYFMKKLQERVTQDNARLILDAAVIVSGIKAPDDRELNKEEASCLCMELIKKGGPAFQVGTSVYRELPQ